jgi:hypothetical protein
MAAESESVQRSRLVLRLVLAGTRPRMYGPRAADRLARRRGMWRKVGVFALLAALCALLSACDKCGGFQQLRFPDPAKVCSGAAPK